MNHVPYLEFYITNVCNYNCKNCNRFNNFNFTGHQLWDDYKDIYKQWANIITADRIGILGGEPLLNPSIVSWISGIANLFPKSKIVIITNGSQLHRWPELYELLKSFQGRVSLSINVHSLKHKEEMDHKIEKFLNAPIIKKTTASMSEKNPLWIECYNRIKDPAWPDCETLNDFYNLPTHIQSECHDVHRLSPEIWLNEVYGFDYFDKNNISIQLSVSDGFNNSTVIFNDQTQELNLNRSDPEKAFSICYFKKCHHFIRGKLYKCGPVGLLPEFINQFNVNITANEAELINSYKPAEISWQPDMIKDFVDELNSYKSIPQCTFCPENFIPEKFEYSTKKIKLVKK
jgi:organic radical activating enzyme